MLKLTSDQRAEMISMVTRINTEKMITVLEESGPPLSDEEMDAIELCSMVCASAIGLALQYLYELEEKYH